VVLNVIKANMRTEQLLLQSQGLTEELQNQSKELQLQQQELRRTNLALEKQAVELEEKASLLAEQNAKVEIKSREVEQARRSLEEKAEQLALASRYKSEFLANMSHELRTPLNSLLILARLLADNPENNLSQKQTEYALTIYTCGTDLLSLINEILDVSKVESGKMQVELRAVLLGDLVQELRRAFQPLADQKQLTWVAGIEPGTSETIFSDPHRLQQVLKNLLSNAFKFTDGGAVALRVRMAHGALTSERQSPRAVAFEVSDTGIGIPSDKQELIFEAFQQADGTTSRKYGGTGLGLSISRQIARLLGGEIRVMSAPGHGSTFTLLLPESLESSPRPVSAEEGEQRLLLLVEDIEPEGRRVASAIAELGNIEIVAVTTAEQALCQLERRSFDCILVDLVLPGLDGLGLVREVKRRSEFRDLPVIVYTGSRFDPEEDEWLKNYSCSVILTNGGKSLDELTSRVASLFHRVVVPKSPLTDADLAGKTVLIVDDDVRNIFALSSAVESAGVRVLYAENGRAAIETLAQNDDIDLVFMDIMMPQMDGFETIRTIRQNAALAGLPIIALTANALSEDRERCLAAGASDYISKPVEIETLFARIRQWTSSAHSGRVGAVGE
jgi:signal transduction histidine kinase/CheY-like chemotaxis protein